MYRNCGKYVTKIKRAETIYVFEYVLINGHVSNTIVARFLFDGPEISLGLAFQSVLLIVDKDYVSQKPKERHGYVMNCYGGLRV